jgi:hypothetical protein
VGSCLQTIFVCKQTVFGPPQPVKGVPPLCRWNSQPIVAGLRIGAQAQRDLGIWRRPAAGQRWCTLPFPTTIVVTPAGPRSDQLDARGRLSSDSLLPLTRWGARGAVGGSGEDEISKALTVSSTFVARPQVAAGWGHDHVVDDRTAQRIHDHRR